MLNGIVRRILYRILGDKNYLSLVSNVFLRMYHSGKARKKYPEMYLLNRFVSEGNTCIDIGANLGYYTIPLAGLVGNSGKVIAVEPVELFREVLKKNLSKYNVTGITEIVPYALGDVDGKEIEMGTPEVDGLIHFGYTRILTQETVKYKIRNTYKATVFRPRTIFNGLTALHFIKCDIEGAERSVIPEFLEIIKKFRPQLQIEITSEENRKIIIDLLNKFEYRVFYYLNDRLIELINYDDNIGEGKDLYFLQPFFISSLKDLIKT